MSLITANNLSKSFGAQDIFEGISLSIPRGARIALVGSNGVGKTTLIRILIGQDFPNSGVVQHAKELTIGYLPQEASLAAKGTLWQTCLEVFSDLIDMEEALKEWMQAMADPGQSDEAVTRYGSLEQAFEQQGGYTYEMRIKQTLSGLGFDEEDFHRPITQLSGGERTRALLAKLLLESPDVMMLDEPTNHLDIEAVEWLESFLKDWDGALVVVSHDRYFLDQVAETIWEMTPALEVYSGNYSTYLSQREERYARRLAEYEAQTAFIEKEQEFIRRNIAGQNTSQAKGRRRRLERLLEDSRLAPPPSEPRRMHINLNTRGRSGDIVLRTHNLEVGYHDEGKPLFSCPDLLLQRQECAAIIGPNGAGKTTFLKTILEKIPPYSGKVTIGASLVIGYFAQAHEGLDPDRTLMMEIDSVSPNMLPAEIRNYLAKFLFTGDDVFRKVGTLSGGERGRLALAKLSLSDANLLLLDEPTNHLDLPTQEVLESVLSNFPGTILLVSHDRYLIDSLASQIWEVEPQGRSLQVFRGSYTQFKAHQLKMADLSDEKDPVSTEVAHNRSFSSQQKPSEKPLSKYERRKAANRLEEIEKQIQDLETKQKTISDELANPPADSNQVLRLGEDYVSLQGQIESLMEEWSELHEKLAE
ncbi:MAG TPA: ABC transporter ATP-binding protein [Anaerolineaceae bacterium]|nr:MAG: Putative ABC transporter ATP-binding protein [Anaerolineaceae bacterium 46_22]HAF48107.1 ABC transporter ATP-binding protein [Anaerolineaceae bacterium]